MLRFQTREGTYNNLKNFTVAEGGNTKGHDIPVVASVAIEEGTFLAPDVGTGIYVVASSTSKDLVLLRQAIRSTDADFAVSGKIKHGEDIFHVTTPINFTVGAGGALTQALVGTRVNLHTDGKSLDITPAVGGQFTIVKVVDATRGVAVLNATTL